MMRVVTIMPLLAVKCAHCGTDFLRARNEIKKCERAKANMFCTAGCMHAFRTKWGGNAAKIPGGNAKRTEFTPFRRLKMSISSRCSVNAAKYANTGVVTLQEMLDIWNEQRGVCPYTGWIMILPHNGSGWKDNHNRHLHASVDRKDPSKGYSRDNVQFTCLIANLAKNDFSDATLINFCGAVSNLVR